MNELTTDSQQALIPPPQTKQIKQAKQVITYQYTNDNKPDINCFAAIIVGVALIMLFVGVRVGQLNSESSHIGRILEQHDEKVLKEAFKNDERVQETFYIKPLKRDSIE